MRSGAAEDLDALDALERDVEVDVEVRRLSIAGTHPIDQDQHLAEHGAAHGDVGLHRRASLHVRGECRGEQLRDGACRTAGDVVAGDDFDGADGADEGGDRARGDGDLDGVEACSRELGAECQRQACREDETTKSGKVRHKEKWPIGNHCANSIDGAPHR